MNTIFTKILYELEEAHNLVLVTIVSQEGSSPRGLGAQMLVGAHGRISGTIGGGTVELHSEQYALSLLHKRQSDKKTFSLKKDAKNTIGMVCGGDITVWFQFIDAALPFWSEFSEQLLQLLSEHQNGWLALNMHSDALPALLNADGTIRCGNLSAPISSVVPGTFLHTKNSQLIPLPVQDRAILFGGGHCTQALVPVLDTLGFRVTVMDNRPDFSKPELFPAAETVICGDYTKIAEHIKITSSDYVVIMTNGHSHDLDVQLQILQNPPVYVGVIGSKSKKAFVNQRLKEAGISDEVIRKVHSPIGTAIKAVTPEEIAISIAGEMIYERALLREANGIKFHGCPMH